MTIDTNYTSNVDISQVSTFLFSSSFQLDVCFSFSREWVRGFDCTTDLTPDSLMYCKRCFPLSLFPFSPTMMPRFHHLIDSTVLLKSNTIVRLAPIAVAKKIIEST
jgi:hypothetical protein